MNIFYLDKDPKIAAQMLGDGHVPKMILETAQILCSAFEPGSAPYRRTHYNHPCCKWARESKENFLWLVQYGYKLSEEHMIRFNPKRVHASTDVILWCHLNIDKLEFPKQGFTMPAQAMPEQYRSECSVEAYRKYYLTEKKGQAHWDKIGVRPYWAGKE